MSRSVLLQAVTRLTVLMCLLVTCAILFAVAGAACFACAPTCRVSATSGNPSSNGGYWSGTNGTVWATFDAGSGKVLTHVKLTVEDKVYLDKTTGLGTQTYSSPVYSWSSTQWANGTPIDFTAECWNNSSQYTSDSFMKYGRNRGYAVYNSTLSPYGSTTAGYAASACSSSNHTVTGPYADAYTAILGSGGLPSNQVFYTWTHADGGDGFGDGYYDPGPPPTGVWITAADVSSALGSGRSTSDPGFNIVFVDGCQSAAVWDLYSGFTRNGQAVVQSYLGWTDYVYNSDAHRLWTQTLWNELANKSTMGQARTTATLAVPYYNFSRQPVDHNHAGYRLHQTY